MENPAEIARAAGFELSTVDAEVFEQCFDLHGGERVLATLIWDGKPQNAHTDMSDSDAPVGWCIEYSDEIREGAPVIWSFSCPDDRLDLATAIACGMVTERLHKKGWWEPLPDHRVWEHDNPGRVKAHQRFEIDPPPSPSD